jgi:hypothetical protein
MHTDEPQERVMSDPIAVLDSLLSTTDIASEVGSSVGLPFINLHFGS